ncbi:hypothetical protein CHS0354_005475 [Potamilus streckersoni]|uniref:Chitin-binding type-2 domain-containing protein n=1 Tax=Potamilus streckersoni TaxID=2493646 RepID=A0AAE0SG51_9BIVA|nr:hypothetical protein CHS0354_005475 [Potamilus streckersoni]
METFRAVVLITIAALYTASRSTSASCVEFCTGQRNGNYQHCSDCNQYVACSNGIKYVMPCPSNLVWDDRKKRCEWTSRTCGTVKPPTTTTKPTSTQYSVVCVESCTGKRNGNYQHCSDCHQYVACSNEIKYIMPCPSNLVWDDVKKRCEWTSRTCGIVKPPTTTTKPTSTKSPVVCVESCTGKRNGNYQHCSDCHQYVACSNEIKYVMPCPSNLVWDDVKKRCEWTSRTCGTVKPPTTTTKPTSTIYPGCVESCSGQRNGNYQHCSECNQYVACSNGIKYVMPCPSNLVWDDVKKRCEWTSPTCGTTKLPGTNTSLATTFIPGCVQSCAGQPDGNYQHCSDCQQYVACSNGYKYNMPCPSNLVWDDMKKRCEWASQTCGGPR